MRYIFLSLLLSIGVVSPVLATKYVKEIHICKYLEENPGFKESLKTASAKWGVRPELILAIIKKESNFHPTVVGTRTSVGWTQAKTFVWEEYQHETKQPFRKRECFADAVDFIGWYVARYAKLEGKDPNDAYHAYLNYRLGYVGAHTYPLLPLAVQQAKKVVRYAEHFRQGLKKCM